MTQILVTLIVSSLIICWAPTTHAQSCGINERYVMSRHGFRPTCRTPQRPDIWADAHPPHMACLCLEGYVYINDKLKYCVPKGFCGYILDYLKRYLYNYSK